METNLDAWQLLQLKVTTKPGVNVKRYKASLILSH